MKTAVVILNWNTKGFLEKFLPGLLASVEGMDAEVIVADSASTDGSRELLREQFPAVQRIELAENFGFTGGYNRALNALDAEYYVLINTDVEVPAGWLEPLVAYMDAHPECGACGPKLLSYNARNSFEYAGAAGGYIDRYGYPFCRGRILGKVAIDNGQFDGGPKDVFWISGACLLVRSSLWKALGGLDDRFFAHFDEIDLCWRIQLAGYRVTCIPASKVWHVGGGTLPQGSPFKLKLNFRNNLLMLENNLPATIGRRKARSRIFIRKVLDGCAALGYLLTFKWSNCKAVWEAHREYRVLRAQRPAAPDGIASVQGYWQGLLMLGGKKLRQTQLS